MAQGNGRVGWLPLPFGQGLALLGGPANRGTWGRAMLALGTSLVLPAQTPDQDALAAELLQVVDTPVESVSKRLQKPIEAPQAVEVITSDQIRASGAFRLADVLRLAASVQVWEMDGERTTITLRGMSPQGIGSTVQILVDGVPIFNVVAMPIDLNGLPVSIDTIDKVEIVRGPSSSLYGANAQMGVVAITTRRAGEGLSGSLRSGVANGGLFRQEAFVAFSYGAFSITSGAAGSSERDLGRGLPVMDGSGARLTTRDASHGSQFYVRPEVRFDGGAKAWAAFGYGDAGHNDQTAYSPVDHTPLARVVDRSTDREIIQAGWSQPWSQTFSTECRVDQKVFNLRQAPLAQVSGSAPSAAAIQAAVALDPALGRNSDFFHDRVRRSSIQANWDPASGVHLIAGLDSSRIQTGANVLLSLAGDGSYSASGGFVSLDWKVGAWTLSGGARAANETLGGTSTSPRFTAVWSLDETSTLRLGYFTSTRSPMASEKAIATPASPLIPFEVVPNPDLRSEKVEDYEIGYRKHWRLVALDVTGFVNRLKRIVGLAPYGSQASGPQRVAFQNTPDTFTDSGVEVSVTAELTRGVLAGWNFSSVRFKDPLYGLDQQADYSPKGQSNLWIRMHRGWFFGFAALEEIGSYTVVAPGGQQRTNVNAHAQTHINLGVTPVEGLSLSIYGINASREGQVTSNMGLLDMNALRHARREVGFQAAFRF